jgi:hypothetical protein
LGSVAPLQIILQFVAPDPRCGQCCPDAAHGTRSATIETAHSQCAGTMDAVSTI